MTQSGSRSTHQKISGLKMTKHLPQVLLFFIAFQTIAYANDAASSSESEAIMAQLIEIAEVSQSGLPMGEMTDRYLSYFAANPTLLPAGQAALTGREAIQNFYNGAFRDIVIESNIYRDPIIVVNGDMATRRYIGTAVLKIADQPDPVSATNRYLDVLIKEDGEWKMLWHSWVPVDWE